MRLPMIKTKLKYRHMRHALRMALACVPLMMVLVGSCKTSENAMTSGLQNETELRIALFPRPIQWDESLAYYPAEGYITRAQKYLQHAPASWEDLSEMEIGYVLGTPDMERIEGDMKVWQFRTQDCVVDIYLTPAHQEDSPFDVAFVDAHSARHTPSACLGRVMDRGELSSRRT